MLKVISDLPEGVVGVDAHGKVTREDYEKVLGPLLDEAHRHGKRIRFLYSFGPDFSEFTAGAAWDDVRLGLRHLRLFERCAVVSDTEWIRKSTQLMGSLMPCPVKAFRNEEMPRAIDWLAAPARESNLSIQLIADKSVLVIEPKGPLAAEDFDRVAAMMDPWIEQHHGLRGLVIRARRFPGWENFGGMVRHIQFVRGHQRDIHRIAVASTGFTELVPKVMEHFVKAEMKSFEYDHLEDAIMWAAAPT